MEKYCGSYFWDPNITWYTDQQPNFTKCFQKTVLIWVPCFFLWIFARLQFYYISSSKCKLILPNLFNKSKLVITMLLIMLSSYEVSYSFIFSLKELYIVDVISPAVKVLTFILVIFLERKNRKAGIRSSGVIFIFWLLLLIGDIPYYVSLFVEEVHKEKFILHTVYVLLIVVVCTLNCFRDAKPSVKNHKQPENVCPENDAPLLSKLLYLWFEPLVWKGYRNPLDYKDLWNLSYRNTSAHIVPIFNKYWKCQTGKIIKTDNLKIQAEDDLKKKDAVSNTATNYKVILDENSTGYASIIPPIFRSFLPSYVLGAVLKFIADILVFISPLTVRLMIRFMNGNEPVWRGFFYAFLLFFSSSVQTLILARHYQQMYKCGMLIKTSLISTIVSKALRISNVARRDYTLGEVVNLMSVDVERLVVVFNYINMLWSTPLQTTIVFIFLWQILGPSALAILAVLIILMPINAHISSVMKKLQIKQLESKDKRIKLTNEILSGLKILKLYAWESSFKKQIEDVRKKEVKVLKTQLYYAAATTVTWICTPLLVLLGTLAVYVLSDKKHILNAEIAFVTLAFFSIIRFPLYMFPVIISEIVQASVSVKRINKFLNSPELQPLAVTHDLNEKDTLVIENGFFSWGDQDSAPILKNINLRIQSGSLVAVVGSVGSGKSSLISALLGEMRKFSGYVNTKGSVAYVPQQAWIQNATLRSNITFGDVLQQQFYDQIITACALKYDLDILPAGDLTEIGEKGINLSGGQKQRISLARAVYNDADIYFLDDPLSAVDSRVGSHIFENVIGPNGLLKNKTRLLVTHSITHLTEMDLIVVLKNGTITEIGKYEDLLDENGDFSDFLLTYLKENELENEEAKPITSKSCSLQTPMKLKKLLKSTSQMEEKISDELSANGDTACAVSIVNSVKTHIVNDAQFPVVPDVVKGQVLIEKEKMKTGNVKWSVYIYYFSSAGFFLIFMFIVLMFLFQIFFVLFNTWLAIWSSDKDAVVNDEQDVEKRDFYLIIYALLGLCQGFTILLANILLRLGCWKSSRSLHHVLLNRVMRVPMQFIDKTPVGRILSRFAEDIEVVDNKLPYKINELIICFFEVGATLLIISYNTPKFMLIIVPIGVLYYLVQMLYISTSRQLKRLESASKSPIYSHFAETISGAQSIRAYGKQNQFIKESERKLDANQACYYPAVIATRWLSVRLETVGNLIVFFSAFFGILERDNLTPGQIGLSVSYALQIIVSLNWIVRMTSEVETYLVAVERIQEYSKLPQEANLQQSLRKPISTSWPEKGEIVFQDYQLRYRGELDLVLKGISFEIKNGEKIGIVGRTGAGKSSLTLGMFRIIEAAGGKIIIDGVDISTIDLHTLRSRLTIIPQEPVLFSGTVRLNLDPLEKYSDDQIWRALELSNLKKHIAALPSGLQYEVAEGGENFSVGQRQLICLVRALLRKTKILILDEATAAIDPETDDFIQSTIRREFNDCTVLTVAHRLNTIMDYDRIVVLDQGRLIEFDTPATLLKSKNSIFYSMALKSGLV